MRKISNLLFTTLISVGLIASVIAITPPKQKKTNAERLHDAILLYADSFDVPLNVAFNVARMETGYLGPNHDSYNHKQVSSCGALGAMQIMPRYASYFAGFKVNKQDLRDSIELNVYISMKTLRKHYNTYGDWKKSLGAYHTGKPVVNWYAKSGVKPNYKSYWVPEPFKENTSDSLLVQED